MNTNEVANILEHLKEGFGPYFKITEREAFDELIQIFKDAPDVSIKQFSNQVRTAWGTTTSIPSSSSSPSRSRSAGKLSVNEALELYRTLAEEAPSLSLEEVEVKCQPISNMTVADLKSLAQQIPIAIPNKLNKAEVVKVIISPLRQRAIDATRKKGFDL